MCIRFLQRSARPPGDKLITLLLLAALQGDTVCLSFRLWGLLLEGIMVLTEHRVSTIISQGVVIHSSKKISQSSSVDEKGGEIWNKLGAPGPHPA